MMIDCKHDFPQLDRKIDGKSICYLDSASTTLKPRSVLEAEKRYNEYFCANIHRGQSILSEEASFHYEQARRTVAAFINAEYQEVVFTLNSTSALNLIADGLNLTDNDTIACHLNAHHSNILPWMSRANVKFIDQDPLSPLQLDDVARVIEEIKPKILAITWVSNVNGIEQAVEDICQLARDKNTITVIDAAQYIPHKPINVKQLGCDFLTFSGHKMLGPSGTGVLWGREDRLQALTPKMLGGGSINTVDLMGYELKAVPYRFEAGTPNIAGVIGLAAAIDYLSNIGYEKIHQHDTFLANRVVTGLRTITGIEILHTNPLEITNPLISIRARNKMMNPDLLCRMLSDNYKIMTRSGTHCAHPMFNALELSTGSLRISPYIYTTGADIDLSLRAIEEILWMF